MSIRVQRKRPDAYQHGDLRNALVQAGLKLLAEKGADGLSLRAAAELAGVSHAAPYRHFKDKAALVAAIAEEGFRLLTRRMRDEMAACEGGDVMARLHAAGRGYTSFALEHPDHLRTIFGWAVWPENMEASPETASLQIAGQESYDVLRELVVEGLAQGRLRAGDPDEIALAAWSIVHGFSRLLIDGQLRELRADPEQVRLLTDRLLGMLQRGLGV
jgi:AcrR family transcriptional regulator